MRARALAHAVLWLFAAALPSVPAAGQSGTFRVSCEGTESTGGGARRYQYTLVNAGPVHQTLTRFYVGTEALDVDRYENWTAPPGFAPVALVGDWNALSSSDVDTTFATGTKTPHGVPGPAAVQQTSGAILWTGSRVVAPGLGVTFGFDHPSCSWDVEWIADHPWGISSSQTLAGQPVAGPVGTFSNGYVHAPRSESAPIFYCTAKPSDGMGCVAEIRTSDPCQSPVSGALNYSVIVVDMDANRPGIFFGSVAGPYNLPFLGGTLCAQQPLLRLPVQFGFGTPGQCDGTYSLLINDGAVIPDGPDAGPGGTSYMQAWYRSPSPIPWSSGLSDAVELHWLP